MLDRPNYHISNTKTETTVQIFDFIYFFSIYNQIVLWLLMVQTDNKSGFLSKIFSNWECF